jgi:hypothetical protein
MGQQKTMDAILLNHDFPQFGIVSFFCPQFSTHFQAYMERPGESGRHRLFSFVILTVIDLKESSAMPGSCGVL